MNEWLQLHRGDAPLIISVPHTGTAIPDSYMQHLVSPWLARKDCDWWIEQVYAFSKHLGVTWIRTNISRTVIDVNRDPSGVSLYPGQATTELCPTTTFDGEPLYKDGAMPDAEEVERRKRKYFEPYHAALTNEVRRLRNDHEKIVVYDCHSIRSRIPRLFDGELPNFNIGTNSGASCDETLTKAIEDICAASDFSQTTNGRFKGGYITRSHGKPADGIHAIQMELACRGYMRETPGPVGEGQWPSPYDSEFAEPMRATLEKILLAALDFAQP